MSVLSVGFVFDFWMRRVCRGTVEYPQEEERDQLISR